MHGSCGIAWSSSVSGSGSVSWEFASGMEVAVAATATTRRSKNTFIFELNLLLKLRGDCCVVATKSDSK